MKYFLFTICSLAILTSCSNNSKNENETNNTINQEDTVRRNQELTKTVINFLNWYKANHSRLSSIELVKNSNNEVFDSTKFYTVDFEATDRYLSELKKSTCISEAYLNKWRDYFKTCEANFKKNPQNDGPPDGFEYDLVMLSQEYDDDLNNINKALIDIKPASNSTFLVTCKFPSSMTLGYTLAKENDHWLISDIQNNSK